MSFKVNRYAVARTEISQDLSTRLCPNALRANYAFKPIAELALRSNQTVVPQRLNAALDFPGGGIVFRVRYLACSLW